MNNQWFDASKEGLQKLLNKRGKFFALAEIIANAWDTSAKRVDVSVVPVPGRPQVRLIVEDDDPDGFADLSHAFTLFAESSRKDSPEKRGRFNLGEKLALALCDEAVIQSTKGTVRFNGDGTRTRSAARRQAGSSFSAVLRMTRQEVTEVEEKMRTLLVPSGVVMTFNGATLAPRTPLRTFEKVTLPTVRTDEEGNLVRTSRQTTIDVYDVLPGEEATIYEMGIPVVASGDRYHVNVAQKVPLSLERDNVPASYLRAVRALVLEAVADTLDTKAAAEKWVTDALTAPDVSGEAVRAVVAKRFGEKAAIFDPSDREANSSLVASGYNVVHGGSLPAAAWENVRAAGALRPSGAIRPTPRPYGDGPPVKVVPPEDWTPGMGRVVAFTKALAWDLLGVNLSVRVVDTTNNFSACYSRDVPALDFNLGRLGVSWFDVRDHDGLATVVDLVIHELGHHFTSDHLSDKYHNALTWLAAQTAVLALKQPEVFLRLREGHY